MTEQQPELVPAGEQEELREDASYESMNLAVMVLSDCGHSSNYTPLLERVAGRIDSHVERLLTAQQADRAMRAQAAPAAQGDAEDAARYRWLREHKALNNTHCWHFQGGPIIPGLLTLDAAIDAALAAQGGTP